jgi:DNA polymerase-3 subunit gamma/tau
MAKKQAAGGETTRRNADAKGMAQGKATASAVGAADTDAEGKSHGKATAIAKSYVVLARKYRPQTFDDLIGQEAMVQTLRNAFASGRIAHGYMLTGVRGVGKTTTARILARALNYETDTHSAPSIDMPALGRHCAEIMESRHPDVIEMDAASNTGVDNMREIIENARYRPIIARTKVFIIDEVHMLSKGAFNAILKTLEEPPPHVKFIFATTEIRKVPLTVLSRCQRFDLRRVDVPRLVAHLSHIAAKEGARVDDEALVLIARAAEGSVRDALSILDQAIASLGQDGKSAVTSEAVAAMLGLADRGRIFDLLERLLSGSAATALRSLDELHRDGGDPAQILADLAAAIHISARIKAIGPEAGGEGLSAEEKRRAGALAERLSTPLLARAWQMLLKGLEEVGKAPDPLAAAEMVLIRIAHTADLPPPDEIIKALGAAGSPLGDKDRSASPRPPAAGTTLGRADQGAGPVAAANLPETAGPMSGPSADEPDPDLDADPQGAEPLHSPATAPSQSLTSFVDVVRLAGERRDAKLKVHLEENVSLVRFDAAAGAIDLFLLPPAPRELANDLREKLNAWTGRRWVVVLSNAPGEPPIGEVRRARKTAEIAALKTHPAVAAVFEQFPDAEISDVRPLPHTERRDSATGGGDRQQATGNGQQTAPQPRK